jgi:cyclase
MLTKRIIALIVVQHGRVVQSKNFESHLPIGSPRIAAKYLTDWGADEILYLDITSTKFGSRPNYRLIEECAKSSNVPLTVGGGISSIIEVRKIFNLGADKVSINSAASPELFQEISQLYGAQAIVFSMDVKRSFGKVDIYEYKTKKNTGVSVSERLNSFSSDSYGEILIQCVDRDGSQNGYDLEFFHWIAAQTNKPIIAAGGYGKPSHLDDLLKQTRVSACVIGNVLFHYEQSLALIKSYLGKDSGIRVESNLLFPQQGVDEIGRVVKPTEEFLNNLLYTKTIKEVI